MSKRLSELPGFEDAVAFIRLYGSDPTRLAVLDTVGDLVVRGISRFPADTLGAAALDAIAMGISMVLRAERRRLRLVPRARPVAANDCEAP